MASCNHTFYIAPLVQDWIKEFQNTVRGLLPPIENLSQAQARSILRRYTAAVEGNFLGWLGLAVFTARLPVSRFAAEENLMVECRDDHQGMLHEFAASAGALPGAEEYKAVYQSVFGVRKILSKFSELESLALVALLEGASVVFAPYLGELAKKLDSKNLKYAEVHGEADKKHLVPFLAALSQEMGGDYKRSVYQLQVTEAVIFYLYAIFSPKS